jgi:integrase
MARTINEAPLTSPTARQKLKIGRQAHWRTLVPGRSHLGYRRKRKDRAGVWLLRRLIDGVYRVAPLGIADDLAEADGDRVLSFTQANEKASKQEASEEVRPVFGLTVRQAIADYIEFQEQRGKPTDDAERRAVAHILPKLGGKRVEELTSATLRKWLADLAAEPALKRTRRGQPRQFKAPPTDDEAVRRRRSSANRVLGTLKAALNHAFDEGRVATNAAWGRRLKPFENVDGARVRYLEVAEATRLINAADAEFRPLLHAALQTGARYSELCRLAVHDFHARSRTVAIRKSKSGKPRHIVLTDEGLEFFAGVVAGRAGSDTMFVHGDGQPWKPSQQARPMSEAVARAKISPPISFHGLRHTWASLAVMAGMPLMVVARNLGHVDTRMVEKHYGHLAPSYVADAIAAHAPRFGAVGETNVKALR